MDSLLTTGDVARLCGVTPDAVLKWIKKGKLPATRTPGGHYRIPRESCADLGLDTSHRATPTPSHGQTESERSGPRCWEYFGRPGNPPETCRRCLVYQARVQHCYKLAELGEKAGHRCVFCRTDCADCPFYRASIGLATKVLVITRNHALTRRFEKHIDASKVSLHFARTGYESSTLIGILRPALVVVDGELSEASEGNLVELIQNDDRIPGVKVFLAGKRPGERTAANAFDVPAIVPFTAKRVEQLAESIVAPGRRFRGDAAQN